MFSKFSYEVKKILNISKEEMYNLGHSYIGTEHFILAILKSQNEIKELLNSFNITYDIFKEKIIKNIGLGKEKEELFILTPLFKKILEESIIITNELNNDEVELSLIFKLLLEEGEGVSYRIFCELNVDIEDLYNSLYHTSTIKIDNYLSTIGVDLTDKAKKGLLDNVIGREKEINNIIEILLRKNKRNPILIGPAGVGKTAIIESLANRIINSNVPYKLLNKKIISISMASLVAGTKYRGEFEEKLLKIIDSLENNNCYILFIDEIHTLVGAGGAEGAIDASNILKPALARGNITVIGATTTEEYRKYIEDDRALSRRFQKVIINEPNKKELFNILKKIKISYEQFHNVEINNDVLKYLINTSDKYIKNRKEPDKSIDLLDEVSSMVSSKITENEQVLFNLKSNLSKYKLLKNEMIKNNNYDKALKYRKKERKIENIINCSSLSTNNKNRIIMKEDINNLISNKYNIIIGNNELLDEKIENIKNKIVNNNEELNNLFSIVKTIFNCDLKTKKSNSIILSGDDKKLKNKIINNICELFFNNNKIILDLSKYANEESINNLIGSFPGYIGYNNKNNVFESLKENPFCLIIFNNYDYACLKVKELIKEIIKNLYFIDSNGYKIDFSNCLLIFNYNVCKNKTIGFNNLIKNNTCEISALVNKIISINKMSFSML